MAVSERRLVAHFVRSENQQFKYEHPHNATGKYVLVRCIDSPDRSDVALLFLDCYLTLRQHQIDCEPPGNEVFRVNVFLIILDEI
jgi:hypothetical protein